MDLDIAPRYEALSYTWGHAEPRDYVICNGVRKSVTPTLGSALRRLRLTDRTRVVWIDAICVNQDDVAERTQQVRLMKDIYTLTSRVIIWLGADEDDKAKTAVGIIETAASYYREEAQSLSHEQYSVAIQLERWDDKQKSKRSLPQIYKNRPVDDKTPSEVTDSTASWEAIAWFYRHSWFTRMWIIQEVTFAPALLYIGDIEVSWESVALAAAFLRRKDYARSEEDSALYVRAMDLFHITLFNGHNWSWLLQSTFSKATDPRDMVFALIGLFDRESRSSPYLQPDYGKSVADVYIDVIRHAIELSMSADETDLASLWAYASFEARKESSSSSDAVFPSWVIRWDVRERERAAYLSLPSPMTGKFRTGGPATSQFANMPRNLILSVRGVRVGDIASSNSDSDIESLWYWVCQQHEPSEWPSMLETHGDRFMHTFQKTRATHDGITRIYGAGDLLNYTSWLEDSVFEDLQNDVDLVGPIELIPPTRLLDFWGPQSPKTFFITEDGCMGVGPDSTQPGDILCVFLGHQYPYVIRPVGEYCKFLGPCYVHNIMKGEVIDDLKAGKYEVEMIELC